MKELIPKSLSKCLNGNIVYCFKVFNKQTIVPTNKWFIALHCCLVLSNPVPVSYSLSLQIKTILSGLDPTMADDKRGAPSH